MHFSGAASAVLVPPAACVPPAAVAPPGAVEPPAAVDPPAAVAPPVAVDPPAPVAGLDELLEQPKNATATASANNAQTYLVVIEEPRTKPVDRIVISQLSALVHQFNQIDVLEDRYRLNRCIN